jgi:hypothetical protein
LEQVKEEIIGDPFAENNFESSLGPTAGTALQTEIINDYPFLTYQDKLKIPYIERYNGNIAVKNGEFNQALKHYSKALFGLKMIYDGDRDTFINNS